MKKILIPIDFKSKNYDAIDYAINFFIKEPCHFYFFNAFTYDVEGLNTVDLIQPDGEWFNKPENDSEKKLGEIIQKFTSNNSDKKHLFNAVSRPANLIEGMKEVIQEIEIDLVILPGKKEINDATEKYSKNTKRIIENIRECPVMIIPVSATVSKNPQFVLVSNFKEKLHSDDLQSWYELVKVARGTIKIVTLANKDSMSQQQKENQNQVRFQIEMHSQHPITIEYVETVRNLKDFANYHSDYIICLMDKKPDLWRICGLTHSQITNLGPLQSTPLIALHS